MSFKTRKSLSDALMTAALSPKEILDQLSAKRDELSQHLHYFKKYTNTETTIVTPIDPKTNKPFELQPGESAFILRLSKELNLDSSNCFIVLRSFIAHEIQSSLSSFKTDSDFKYDDALVPRVAQFYAMERIYTLCIWETIFKITIEEHIYGDIIAEFLASTFPSEEAQDKFALSFLPLPLVALEEKHTLNTLFYMHYMVWSTPSSSVVDIFKQHLITKDASDMKVLIILTMLRTDLFIEFPPAQSMKYCHPALDLIADCVNVLNDIPGDYHIYKGIQWYSNAKFDSQMATAAKSVSRSAFQLVCHCFEQAEVLLPWFVSIYKNEPLLATEFWAKDFPLRERREVLDVWKDRFPVFTEVLKGLVAVLSVETVDHVFTYFDTLECCADYVSENYDSDMEGNFYWKKGAFVKFSDAVNIFPPRGTQANLITSGEMQVVSLRFSLSGWTLCLSLLSSYLNLPLNFRATEASIHGNAADCTLILELFGKMFEYARERSIDFLEQVPQLTSILPGLIRKSMESKDTTFVARTLACLKSLKLRCPFELVDIDSLLSYEQEKGEYPFLLEFLDYLNTINCLPYINYLNQLFQTYENWRYIDVSCRYVIGKRILEVCRMAGSPIRVNVAPYFPLIDSKPGDVGYMEDFIMEALQYGQGGVFTGYRNSEIAQLALKTANLEDEDNVYALRKVYPTDVSKCLTRFCERGWSFQKCLAFALEYPEYALNVMECLAAHGFIHRLDQKNVWKLLDEIILPTEIYYVEMSALKLVILSCFVFSGKGIEIIENYVNIYKSIELPTSEIGDLNDSLKRLGLDLHSFKKQESSEYGVEYLYNVGLLSTILKDQDNPDVTDIIHMAERVNEELSLVDATIILIQKWKDFLELILDRGTISLDFFVIILNICGKISSQNRNDRVSLLWITEWTAALQFLLKYWKPNSQDQIVSVIEAIELFFSMDQILELESVDFRQNVSVCLHLALTHFEEISQSSSEVITRVLFILSRFWSFITKQHVAAGSFENSRTLHSFLLQSFTIVLIQLSKYKVHSSGWLKAIHENEIILIAVNLVSFLLSKRIEDTLVLDVLQFIQIFCEYQELAKIVADAGIISCFTQHAHILQSGKLYIDQDESPNSLIFCEQFEIVNTLFESLPENSIYCDLVLGLVGGVYWEFIQERLSVSNEPNLTLAELKQIESISRLFYHLGKSKITSRSGVQNWSVAIGYQSLSLHLIKYGILLLTHPNMLEARVQFKSKKEKEMSSNNTWNSRIRRLLLNILVNCVHNLRWSTGSEEVLVGMDTMYNSVFSNEQTLDQANSAFYTSHMMELFTLFREALQTPSSNSDYIRTGIESILVLLLQEYRIQKSDSLKSELEQIIQSGYCDTEYIDFVRRQLL